MSTNTISREVAGESQPEQAKEPEIDPQEYGFRWYPILETDPEWRKDGQAQERIIGLVLKKAPRDQSRSYPTGFVELRERQHFVAIVSERYKVLPNEVVARMASSVARRFNAKLVEGQHSPDFEREWYLHREYMTDEQVTGLGVEARKGFFVENAVNKSHALVISPTIIVNGVPLVAGRQTLKNLRNNQGRRLDYRRHTKNMVEEGLSTMIEAALEAADTFAFHCQHLAELSIEDWPDVVPELLELRASNPLPNKIFPDTLLDNKGNPLVPTTRLPSDPEERRKVVETWPSGLKATNILALYSTMAANIRALESNDERKTALLEALGVPFAAREMVSWLMKGAKA